MTAPQGSRLALAFIFTTMLIDTIGLGIIIPVFPKLLSELTGEGMSCAAWWSGWLAFVFAGAQFLCAPLIGNLSDRFGRRPVLIASLLALGLDYLVMGIAPTIAWLFVTRAISGVAGVQAAVAKPSGTLPFTGLSLLATLLVSLGLIGLGIALRRGEEKSKTKS